MGRRIATITILLMLVILAVAGIRYLYYRSTHAVSDAAFIRSDRLATLAFKVGGNVILMAKEADTPVRKGELLARIDPVDLNLTRERILHQIGALQEKRQAAKLKRERLAKTLDLEASIANAQIAQARSRVEAQGWKIRSAEARLQKLRRDLKRYETMRRRRLVAPDAVEAYRTKVRALSDEIAAMKAGVRALEATVEQARDRLRMIGVRRRQLDELDRQIAAMGETIQGARKELAAVEKKLSYTRLTAPFDGIVAKKFFDAPRVVKRGAPVYALVDPTKLYCQVLLSERKLRGVRVGNDATVEVDALGGRKFHGKVEAIAPASASTFSLVPRDIASGEFTKLDQRFEVRIRLDSIEGLRAGMGATVAISRSAGESLVTGH
ncbi:HlyD family secretion protein [Nitratifractor sp.]